jgi:quinol monooxygenase YgiN
MTVMMIRTEVKEDHVADVETAVQKMFAAIKEAEPRGVRYASSKLPDGVTFVVLLELEGEANPLGTIPEFTQFQENLKGWLAGPPTAEPLQVIGSYQLFSG